MLHKQKRKLLLFLLIVVFSTMFLGTALAQDDADTTEYEDSLAFVDGYEDNLETENFSDKLDHAIDVIREQIPSYATFWALFPALIAIILALLTKEVYLSLFIGILSGSLIYAQFHPIDTATTIFSTMTSKLADEWNIGILIFLVILGIMVIVMNKAGGSAAYGTWASKKITTRGGAGFATMILGILIFVDDYFNCLTVGNVMRPVTDKHKISRAKLAYLIDATAAPICIIAPVSSWAAAVSGIASGDDGGIGLFIRAIPYNFYALLTILMMIFLITTNFDFGPMKKHEDNAAKGDLYTTPDRPYAATEQVEVKSNGKVIDLILPVLFLIGGCVLGMVYSGGFFDSNDVSFVDAFANCDASVGLVLGSFAALVLTFLFYIPRRVLTLRQFGESCAEGFKAMVPAILILIFAWTLSGITGALGAKIFVAELVRSSAAALKLLLPAIVFLIAIALAFATGTSWGTFGILLPIVVAVLPPSTELGVIAVSACLAGAVCGDHCSPISDTTIMASTGAQSNHINHVNTQLPYAMLVATVSFVSYIIAAVVETVYIALPVAIVLMLATLFVFRFLQERKLRNAQDEA